MSLDVIWPEKQIAALKDFFVEGIFIDGWEKVLLENRHELEFANI